MSVNQEITNASRWKRLLLFCAGITLGSAFCMKWMESDFLFNGEKFTIVGLELQYGRMKLEEIFSGIPDKVHTILSYHLYFDFAFMTGVYPGIASICMIGYHRASQKGVRQLLLIMACLQIVAFSLDLTENLFLLNWLRSADIAAEELSLFHVVAWAKWILALLGFITGLWFLLKKKRRRLETEPGKRQLT